MSPRVAALRAEVETALARFRLVEPVTLEDMTTIAKHLRFALGGAEAEVFRPKPTEPVFIAVWRDGLVVRLLVTPFTSETEATKARGI